VDRRRALDAALIGIGLLMAAAIIWTARPHASGPPSLSQALARLARQPADVAAVRELGLALARNGRDREAEPVMRLAARMGWRDADTQAWLLRRDLGLGAFDAAFARADALLRRPVDDPARASAIAAVMDAARDPSASEPLARRLATRPWWRAGFLEQLDRAPGGTAPVRAILLALARSPARPTPEETAPYINRLVAAGRFDEALADWRRLSPDGAGDLRSGGFGEAPDGTPFAWEIAGGGGGEAAITLREDSPGNRALWADAGGDGVPLLARQMLVLPSGRYVLRWRVQGDGERLRWRVQCVDDGRQVAKAASQAPSPAWRDAALAIDVPADRCRAQWLALAAEPGDGRASAWYDDMEIAPVGPGPSGSPARR